MTHGSEEKFFKKNQIVFSMNSRLVSGAGDIKITKDGNVLLHEMQIQHPTASLIARASTAQDDMTGDGTTSTVLLIGELLKQADILLTEGVHPRILTEGFDLARNKAVEILDTMKIPIEVHSNCSRVFFFKARIFLYFIFLEFTGIKGKSHRYCSNLIAHEGSFSIDRCFGRSLC